MTITYKGNNIGLGYDAATATWGLNNTPTDYIDTDAFSSTDPDFVYTPPEEDDSTEEDDFNPCPEGYIYDSELKQCVIDPNAQSNYMQTIQNGGGGQDDTGIGGTGRPMPKIPEYVGGTGVGITGTGSQSYIPRVDTDGSGNIVEDGGSGIDYGKLFPYETTARTRAQMNEFMLITEGLSKGWIAYDDELDTYRKVGFREQQGEQGQKFDTGMPSWISYMNMQNLKSYNDYFEILDKGWQPAHKQNVWKTFIQGNAKYSLTGGMLSDSFTTRGGKGNKITTINFSKDRYIGEGPYTKFVKGFETKIKEAMAIKNGMIDRDGNVNVNAGGGGYYREDGKFVSANGQVSATGSISSGIQYILSLENSGLILPENLKKRLLKGINTQAMDWQQENALAEKFGYAKNKKGWNDLQVKVNSILSGVDSFGKINTIKEQVIKPKKYDVELFDEVDDGGSTWEPSGPDEVFDDTDSWKGSPGTDTTDSEGGGEGWEPSEPVKKPVKSGYEARREAVKKEPVKSGYEARREAVKKEPVKSGYEARREAVKKEPVKSGYEARREAVKKEPKTTCFHPEQLIGNKLMKDLEPGDLINGIEILGMVKMKLGENMYSLNDVKVTGSHKVKHNDNWIFISDHPESFKINDRPEFVYVPIVKGGTFILNDNEFADYDDEHIETLNNKLKVA